MLKIVVFAPMPSARDNAASALTSGRRRSTRAANRKSRQKFSICFLPRRPLSSSRLDGAACAPETTLRHRGREGSRGYVTRSRAVLRARSSLKVLDQHQLGLPVGLLAVEDPLFVRGNLQIPVSEWTTFLEDARLLVRGEVAVVDRVVVHACSSPRARVVDPVPCDRPLGVSVVASHGATHNLDGITSLHGNPPDPSGGAVRVVEEAA